MSSAVIPVLVFAFSLTLIGCEDWCTLIKPNGTYEGLGMYHHFQVKDEGKGSFVMYNRAGAEWMFEIDYSDDSLSLQMIENSTKESNNMDVVLRFGFYIGLQADNSATLKMRASVVDCTIKTAENKSRLTSECVFDENPKKTHFDNTTEFYQNNVIFKSKPEKDFQTFDGTRFHVFDKLSKNHYFVYEPLETQTNGRVTDCLTKECIPYMKFVKDMDDSLFAKIDDVVDWFNKTEGKGGYLVLFNIDGKPKYCNILQIDSRENIFSTSECKSTEDLQDLFGECFPTVAPTESADPAKDNRGPEGSPPEGTPTTAANAHTLSLFAMAVPFAILFNRF